jgi:hypothetical protein
MKGVPLMVTLGEANKVTNIVVVMKEEKKIIVVMKEAKKIVVIK